MLTRAALEQLVAAQEIIDVTPSNQWTRYASWAGQQGIRQWPVDATRILLYLESRTHPFASEPALSKRGLQNMLTNLVKLGEVTHQCFGAMHPVVPAFASAIVDAGREQVKTVKASSVRHVARGGADFEQGYIAQLPAITTADELEASRDQLVALLKAEPPAGAPDRL